jgi:hypothetical protein
MKALMRRWIARHRKGWITRATSHDGLRDYATGAGSVVDPLPLADPRGATFHVDDMQALASDWQMVGRDVRQALSVVRPVSRPNTVCRKRGTVGAA